jgi:hypothetical protein
MPRWNYQSANEFLVGRRKLHGNIASYTYLERDGDMIVMKYGVFKRGEHSREIVRMYPDGSIRFTRAWNCPSIRDRFNWCVDRSKAMWFDNQRGYWFLRVRINRPAPGEYDTYSFQDGLTIHPDGSVTGYDPEPFDAKIANHLKKIRDRNAIHTVESARGLTVGDVVTHEFHGTWFKDKAGKFQRDLKKAGPYRVKRIKASSTRTLLWLTELDGNPIKQIVYENSIPSERIAYQGFSMRYHTFKRDPFLSAASQANRTVAETAKP